MGKEKRRDRRRIKKYLSLTGRYFYFRPIQIMAG
jgi:hypothetical protein